MYHPTLGLRVIRRRGYRFDFGGVALPAQVLFQRHREYRQERHNLFEETAKVIRRTLEVIRCGLKILLSKELKVIAKEDAKSHSLRVLTSSECCLSATANIARSATTCSHRL